MELKCLASFPKYFNTIIIPAKLPKLEIRTIMAWGPGARLSAPVESRGNASGGDPGGNAPRSSWILGYLGALEGISWAIFLLKIKLIIHIKILSSTVQRLLPSQRREH